MRSVAFYAAKCKHEICGGKSGHRQMATVRNAVRAAHAAGRKPLLLRIGNKTWQNIKGGYPSVAALYQYCHRHFA